MIIEIGHLSSDHSSYDAVGDVLYLSVGGPQAGADSEETPEGHVLRFDTSDQIIGLTIINTKWPVTGLLALCTQSGTLGLWQRPYL